MTTHSAAYEARIKSRGWAVLRQAVIGAACGICECCLAAFATEVHHKTYARLGHERMDDLEALCHECHVEADRERAARTQGDLWTTRVLGWAAKRYGRYGEDWVDDQDFAVLEEEFENWLEDQP